MVSNQMEDINSQCGYELGFHNQETYFHCTMCESSIKGQLCSTYIDYTPKYQARTSSSNPFMDLQYSF